MTWKYRKVLRSNGQGILWSELDLCLCECECYIFLSKGLHICYLSFLCFLSKFSRLAFSASWVVLKWLRDLLSVSTSLCKCVWWGIWVSFCFVVVFQGLCVEKVVLFDIDEYCVFWKKSRTLMGNIFCVVLFYCMFMDCSHLLVFIFVQSC